MSYALDRSNHFKRDYRKATAEVQEATDKALRFLAENPRHPSLRAKIVDETNRIWQARVTRSWRLYFLIVDNSIVLLTLFQHND